MTEPVREWVFHHVEDNRPEVRARNLHLLQLLLASELEDVRRKREELVRDEVRRADARSALRRILARRGVDLSWVGEERLDECTDLDTLHDWLENAAVATTSEEEVFVALPKKRRSRARRKLQ
jgi:hypothetical protein